MDRNLFRENAQHTLEKKNLTIYIYKNSNIQMTKRRNNATLNKQSL